MTGRTDRGMSPNPQHGSLDLCMAHCISLPRLIPCRNGDQGLRALWLHMVLGTIGIWGYLQGCRGTEAVA